VPACKQPDGYAIGLVVPTPDAAKRVYEAVATGRYDQIKSSNDILVNDRGDHWEVFQYPKKAPSFERHSDGSETVTVVAGGGTLELEITKCDGRIIGSYAR
jgi:hypothetical protein